MPVPFINRFSNTAAEVPTLQQLAAPYKGLLKDLDAFLKAQIQQLEAAVQPPALHAVKGGGKRLRPLLVFIAAGAGKGASKQLNTACIEAAAVLELVHIATLVHDDVLDGADLRHGRETVAVQQGAHKAVLVGDVLFSHALKLAAEFPTPDVCRIVARATRQVCSGEFYQTAQRGNAQLSLEAYHNIVELKTGELFGAACQLGAFLAQHTQETAQAAATFGTLLGGAYQIYDDLCDVAVNQKDAGKTLGTDLQTGKFTLPLLLLQQHIPVEALKALNFEDMQAAIETHSIAARVLEVFDAKLDAACQALSLTPESLQHNLLPMVAVLRAKAHSAQG